jgi:hypothetical protein
MGPLDADARRKGHGAMEGSLSKVDKIYRSFRSGRPAKKDRLLFPKDAIMEVLRMYLALCEAMYTADLDPRDCVAAICFWVTVKGPVHVRVLTPDTAPEILSTMMGRYQAVTLGCIFAMKDHDRGITRRWAHPFILGPVAHDLLTAALDNAGFRQVVN